MSHLLVTNDFPPKTGGIQSYLWELWRRLDPSTFTVLTTAHPEAEEFDAAQGFAVRRVRESQMLPTPDLARRVRAVADEVGAKLVVLDPAVPLGLIGRYLGLPYAVVLHGAEVTVPGRLPVSRQLLHRVLTGAVHVVAAGGYPADEGRRVAGRRMPPVTIVPPGVDTDRFHPLSDADRAAARRRLGLDPDAALVVSVSRLVPRKGMDVLLRAVPRIAPADGRPLQVAVAGSGRDRDRLDKLAEATGGRAVMLGPVPDADLADLYGCADVFAMLCRNRWLGLEQEGFGIVFLEAAACAVPQVAGDSGGAREAVEDGVTGLVVGRPTDVAAVAGAISRLVDNPAAARRMGERGRARAVAEFTYDGLAGRLAATLSDLAG